MSLDLDVQLREFCDFMDETQGPLTIDDILERTGEIPIIPGRRRTIRGRPVGRRIITAAAAVIAVVLIGLALRFLPVLQQDVPPATDDIPTTTNSTAPPSQGVEAQGTWIPLWAPSIGGSSLVWVPSCQTLAGRSEACPVTP